jgi:ring-1,2-phenylacetyl-CoA epoxidase subunit PaaE
MLSYTLKVIEIKQETSDCVTLKFKQPGLKKIKFLAGQYLTLTFRINNRRYIRPYSISSAPGLETTINVTVKRIPGGIVSNHIIDQVKVDDLVEVLEPMGDFTLAEKDITTDTNIVLWGAGSGITPLMSIAKYALANKVGKHVTMVYGNRNYESVIFAEEILQLKIDHADQLSLFHFFTQAVVMEDVNPNHVLGRINPDVVLSVINDISHLNDTVHFVCGPAGLKESVKNGLQRLGVDNDKIFSEDFEIVKNPKDFEDIFTRTVQINYNGQHVPVEVVKGKSILEAGLDALIELPYSCQTGSCRLCAGKKLNGNVKVIGGDNAEEDADEILLCCSYPLTDDVEIIIK